MEISIQRTDVNPEQLDLELQTVSGYRGLSTDGRRVRVHMDDSATPQQQAQAESIVLAHDPETLTDRQQAAAERDQHPFFTMTEDEIALWLAEQTELKRWRAFVKFVTWTRDRIR